MPDQVTDPAPTLVARAPGLRRIPGFRTYTPWKSVVACAYYAFCVLGVVASAMSGPAGGVATYLVLLGAPALVLDGWGVRTHLVQPLKLRRWPSRDERLSVRRSRDTEFRARASHHVEELAAKRQAALATAQRRAADWAEQRRLTADQRPQEEAPGVAVPGTTRTVGPSRPRLGLWARHRLHRAEKRYRKRLRVWQQEVDGLREYLELITTFTGLAQAEGLVLAAGETSYGTISGTALVESRVRGGHWVSGSSGLSIPVGTIGGRTVRYRVGRSRGHYVQGVPTPTAIDRGTLGITSRRLVFVGGRQTRECAYAKMIGYRHAGGVVTVSVSNRQKPMTVSYGENVETWFVERLELALAHFHGTVPQLRDRVAGLLGDAEGRKPVAPSSPSLTMLG